MPGSTLFLVIIVLGCGAYLAGRFAATGGPYSVTVSMKGYTISAAAPSQKELIQILRMPEMGEWLERLYARIGC